MLTIFLTNEAQDLLIDEFREDGFSELPLVKQPKALLLEFTEISITVLCENQGASEKYRHAVRFFPPTVNMEDEISLTVSDNEFQDIHEQVDEFLSGETELTGIPADGNYHWLR